jgi:hypothetical protein
MRTIYKSTNFTVSVPNKPNELGIIVASCAGLYALADGRFSDALYLFLFWLLFITYGRKA